MINERLDIVLVVPSQQDAYGLIQMAHTPEYHLGVGYIGSYLQSQGFSAQIIDMSAGDRPLADTLTYIADLNPRVVGFSIVTSTYSTTKQMLMTLRSILKDVLFICGGPHATARYEDCLLDAGFDLVVIGEGEATCREIMNAQRGNRSQREIRGIAFLENGKVIKTDIAEKMELDMLPFPMRNDATIYKYKNQFFFDDLDAPCYNLITTRGCPYRCTFCGVSTTFPGAIRRRSAENVFQEIRYAYEHYAVKYFFFEDSTFVFDANMVRSLCQKIIDARLEITWGAMGRLNHVNVDLYQLMKQAGCSFLFFGVESGNNDTLKLIKKNFTIEEAEEAIQTIKKLDIISNCSFILALPGDTPEKTERTIQTAIRFDPDYVTFSFATPYPGTELWDQCLQDGWQPSSWDDYTASRYRDPIYVPSGMNAMELKHYLKKAYRDFYFRVPYIIRHISKIHNFNALKKHLSAASSLLFKKS